MFTWLVTHMTKILSVQKWSYVLDRVANDIHTIGQSIAHDGACMTVSAFDDNTYTFFAMQESLAKTALGNKWAGDMINLEFPLHIWQALDGHIVTGHIDTIGVIDGLEKADDGSLWLQVRYSKTFDTLVVEKGSIALNGVSLTVAAVMQWWCKVWLIPQTQEETNLWFLSMWDLINIEFDLMGKYATGWGRK